MSLRSFIHQITEIASHPALLNPGYFYWKGLLSVSVSLACLSVSSVALATMRYGDEGSSVYTLQGRLAELGYSTGGVDGVYGPSTETAVYQYQVDQGLYYVDGIAGPETLSSLGLAYLLGTGGTSSLYPGSYGSISSNCGYRLGYVVAVPGADVAEVRRYSSAACQDYSDRGSFVNAGVYESFSVAEREANRLREVNLDARVIHRD